MMAELMLCHCRVIHLILPVSRDIIRYCGGFQYPAGGRLAGGGGGVIDNRGCAAYNAGQPLRVFACGAFRRQNFMQGGGRLEYLFVTHHPQTAISSVLIYKHLDAAYNEHCCKGIGTERV